VFSFSVFFLFLVCFNYSSDDKRDEFKLSDDQKTIRPCNVGGVAGGKKVRFCFVSIFVFFLTYFVFFLTHFVFAVHASKLVY
jgi:hypothetical protein